jgi:hypothetical protein
MASSVRPEPMRPAMPTTSPARTLKDALRITWRSLCSGCQTFQFSTSISIAGVGCALRETVGHVPADHVADDGVLAQALVRIERGYRRAVADHGHGVGDVADLVQLVEMMIEVTPCLQFQHQVEQLALSFS